jgi:hypothetical protein
MDGFSLGFLVSPIGSLDREQERLELEREFVFYSLVSYDDCMAVRD